MSELNTGKFSLTNEITDKVEIRLKNWDDNKIASRIWKHDPTIWKEKPEDDKELSNRLGWLHLAEDMKKEIGGITAFAEEIKGNFENVVLLGMGGSSLAPEVFSKTFGSKEGYPKLSILDSTHPLSVRRILDNYNIAKTLFVVSSKSGGTIETMSFFHTFFNAVKEINQDPGKQFIALTDPGSGLEKMATENKFLKIFSTPPEVGGRFSALTAFGMVPAALIGMDIEKFIAEAAIMTDACGSGCDVKVSPGFYLGALIGELALEGVNKVTFFASPQISSFSAWVEQLVAESTGKDNVGILPVADEEFGGIEYYGKDRFFVYIKLTGDNNAKTDSAVEQLKNAGLPLLEVTLTDKYQLAQEFFRWEMATASSGQVLKINPFDQPNVQLAKTLAGESLAAYKATGSLPVKESVLTEGDTVLYSETGAASIKEAVTEFLKQSGQGSYVAINGFIPMTEENVVTLESFRIKIRNKYKVATTVGFGPRFLHSTGQLHKGDSNKGLFIVITTDAGNDLEVPGQGYSFGTLIAAQGQGDLKALINCGRKTLHLHIKTDMAKAIESLI